jgi:hypothetical protein
MAVARALVRVMGDDVVVCEPQLPDRWSGPGSAERCPRAA